MALKTNKDKFWLQIKRLFVNLTIICFMVGFGYLIYWVTAFKAPELINENQCQAYDFDEISSVSTASLLCLLYEYLPSLVVTGASLIGPFLFNKLSALEELSANKSLMFNLIRTIVLRLASVGLAVFSLQAKVNCDYALGCTGKNGAFIPNAANEPGKCQENPLYFKACSNENLGNQLGDLCEKPICWETYVGQQLYKLTLVDFIVQVCSSGDGGAINGVN